jgi:hypothetical protein
LYHEALQATLFSNLIVGLPPLREYERRGLLVGDAERLKRLQQLPCTGADISTIVEENQEFLTKAGGFFHGENKYKLYQRALGMRVDNDDDADDTSSVMFGRHSYADIAQNLEIIVLSDDQQYKDIVYMVAISHLLQQVVVIFRGTTTVQDFRQDIKLVLASIPNPIDKKIDYAHRDEELAIHLGFREYLYVKENIMKVFYKPKVFKHFVSILSSKKKDEGKDDSVAAREAADQIKDFNPRASTAWVRNNPSRDLDRALLLPYKYQLIIEQVLDVIDEHPDYRLFCTGHSLGGALASILAFEAAADERIPGPISCVNSGAPKAGGTSYLRAFTKLEQLGRLRCAQFSNNRDIIPKLAISGTLNAFAAFCWEKRIFRHAGLQVEFQDKGRYLVHSPPNRPHRCGLLAYDMRRIVRFYVLFFILIPAILVIVAIPPLLISCVPILSCCLAKQGKNIPKYHSQPKYLSRLQTRRNDLEKFTIEELNEKRWLTRSPKLYKYDGSKGTSQT